MTELLIKLFVKDKDDTANVAVRERYGVLAGFVGIAANTLLCISKFIIGALTGSVAVQADAVNNLADIGSNVVTLAGAKLAARPATRIHPYGQARMEYVAALVIALLIVTIGFQLGRESVEKIIMPAEVEFTPAALAVLLLSIGVKLWMGLFTANVGRRINSAAMSAATTDSLCDCISTGAILLSSVANFIWKVNFDGYIGVVVAIFVVYSGVKIVRSAISPLMGEAPSKELVKELADRLTSYDGIIDTHDILIHSYGPGVSIASAHAEVRADGDVMKLHEIIDRAEAEIGRDMGMLLTIHMDPIETDNAALDRAHADVKEVIDTFGGKVLFHDLRMVPGETRNNLIFDIVVPAGTPRAKSAEIMADIDRLAKEKNPTYCCVISVDTDYCGML